MVDKVHLTQTQYQKAEYESLHQEILAKLADGELDSAAKLLATTLAFENIHQYSGQTAGLYSFCRGLITQIIDRDLLTGEMASIIQPILWSLVHSPTGIECDLAAKIFVQTSKVGIFSQFNQVIQGKVVESLFVNLNEQGIDRYSIRDVFVEMMLSSSQPIDLVEVYRLINTFGEESQKERFALLIQVCHATLDIAEEALGQNIGSDNLFIQQLKICFANFAQQLFACMDDVRDRDAVRSLGNIREMVNRSQEILGENMAFQTNVITKIMQKSKTAYLVGRMESEIRYDSIGLSVPFLCLRELNRYYKEELVIHDQDFLSSIWHYLDLIGAEVPQSMTVAELYRRLNRYERLLRSVESTYASQNGVGGKVQITMTAEA